MSIIAKKHLLFAAGAAMALCQLAPAAQAEGLTEPNPSAPLYDKLPAAVKERGYIVSAATGRYPPYNFRTEDGAKLQGVSVDLGEAMSHVIGVPIRTEIAESVASFITGVIAGRYDFVFGPVADTVERQKQLDIVDWSSHTTSFLVKKGNPKGIDGIASTCGLRIAVMKASHTEPVVKKQSELCKAAGKPEVELNILPDQTAMALAIQSDRVDASFASNGALAYLATKIEGQFEVVGAGDNLIGELWLGGVTPKDSPLTPVIQEAWATLMSSGQYGEIMTKWNLQADMIDAPKLNAAK